VRGAFRVSNLRDLAVRGRESFFLGCSLALAATMYLNVSTLQSPVLGVAASILYLVINGMSLGAAFFEKETVFFRMALGILLLICLLGFVGWLAVIIYDLDSVEFALVLFVVAAFSFLSNKVKKKNEF
jgi:uncharacterized membrane protein YfcA